MSGPNKYEILGVAEDADQREIRAAYRKLAMVHHPDKGGDKEEFQKIQSAYETLGDEDARRRYDHQLKNPQAQFADFPGGCGGFDFGDFADLFGGASGGFSFGGGGGFEFFGGGGGGFADFFGAPQGGPDDEGFEDFINSAFFGGRQGGGGGFGGFPGFPGGGASRRAPPSWFFDFDMDDEEYFNRQKEDREERRKNMERFLEEQKEQRRKAKEQFQADKLKREAERPQNNHRKNLRKNILKLVDKEAPELDRDEIEDKLEELSHQDMEALWVVLSTRDSRSVTDCMVDAMADFGCAIKAPKAKKNKKKKGAAKAATDECEAQAGLKPEAAAGGAKPQPNQAKSAAKAGTAQPESASAGGASESTNCSSANAVPQPKAKNKPAAKAKRAPQEPRAAASQVSCAAAEGADSTVTGASASEQGKAGEADCSRSSPYGGATSGASVGSAELSGASARTQDSGCRSGPRKKR